jgi:hypothetical protein
MCVSLIEAAARRVTGFYAYAFLFPALACISNYCSFLVVYV